MVETSVKAKMLEKDANARYFEPTEHMAIIIHNKDYSKVRKAGLESMVDVDPAPLNAAAFKNFLLKDLCIPAQNIIEYAEATHAQLDQAVIDLRKTFKEFALDLKQERKLCLWVYYAGHGVMANTSYLVLNETINCDRFFDMEQWLTTLTSHMRSTCVLAFYDCCRGFLSKNQMRDFNLEQTGLFFKPKDFRNGFRPPASHNFQNIVNCYATAPDNGVLIDSTFSDSLIKLFRVFMKKNGGVLQFPNALDTIPQYEKKAQVNMMCCDIIYIYVEKAQNSRPSTAFKHIASLMEEKYIEKNKNSQETAQVKEAMLQLYSMDFRNYESNLKCLKHTKGNLEESINILIDAQLQPELLAKDMENLHITDSDVTPGGDDTTQGNEQWTLTPEELQQPQDEPSSVVMTPTKQPVKLKPEIRFINWMVICPGRPMGNIKLEMSQDSTGKFHIPELVLKEGTNVQMYLNFIVLHAPVEGLKFIHEKEDNGQIRKFEVTILTGNFVPSIYPYEWYGPRQTLPIEGVSKSSKTQNKLVDAEGNIHLEYGGVTTINTQWPNVQWF